VTGNTVLNAGNSAFGGIVADPLSSSPTVNPDFAGSSVTGNTVWTGPTACCVSCPQAQIAVDSQQGSGNIQSPITSVDVRHCI
jgi:hypothetical protein